MFRLIKRLLALTFLVALLIVGVVVFQLLSFQHNAVATPDEVSVFQIQTGSSIKRIAEELTRQGYIEDPWLFILLAKLKGVETQVQAGEHQIHQGQSPDDLMNIFIQGNSIQYSLTIIEGWTFRQMLDALARSSVIRYTLTDKTDAEIMEAIGYPGQHPEGLFFPDTYRFPKGTTDVDFLRRAYQVMENHLQREWEQRDENIPLESRYEALILASIIEKETGAEFERPLIGGVFTERLRRNMRLQTDPTIIYGMGDDFDGDIRFRELRKDTPYNTYLHAGLTPTPIALPGLGAIRAALHPSKTDALYFVSKGDGTHHFSATLKEHNTAVRKYQLGK